MAKGRREDPWENELRKAYGKNVELLTAYSSQSGKIVNVSGVIKAVKNGLIKLELDDEDETDTKKRVGIYRTSEIIGYVEKAKKESSGGVGGSPGGGPPQGEPGKVTLNVTVQWSPDGVDHPSEVDVILIREDIETRVTTVNGVATFVSSPSGDCTIKGAAVAGFSIPEKRIQLIGKDKIVNETLVYVKENIPVTSVSLNKTNLELVVGEKEQLVATIDPANANNQNVSWSSGKENVATVDQIGIVEAKAEGESTITVTTEDGGKTASCLVKVLSITSIKTPDSIDAISNQVVILPETVEVVLSDGSNRDLPVSWFFDGVLQENAFTIPNEPLNSYELTGKVAGTNEVTTTLTINVTTDTTAIPVSDLDLEYQDQPIETMSIYVGDVVTLNAIIVPENATTKDVIWSSSNEAVATVEAGVVTGISAGWAVIIAEAVDGGEKAYCQFSVSNVPEIELIYPTEGEFDNPLEVTINVYNLLNTIDFDSIDSVTYYMKIEQSGSDRLLGSGTISFDQKCDVEETCTFNVWEHTTTPEGEEGFNITDNYSKEYFFYMSTYEDFPHDDEKTMMTTFKIGSPVPTVPKEDIKVSLEVFEGSPEGITFILARLIDEIAIEDLKWQDYCTNPEQPDDSLKIFTDEVKLRGLTDLYGVVKWLEPKETIKIGGYVLLEVTPQGYVDNLNMRNPDLDDGTLYKEVHLVRDGIIERVVINTPV